MTTRSLLAHEPAEKLILDIASSNITTAAWTQITASTSMPCDAMSIDNTSDAVLLISTGAVGAEDNEILPIYIKACEEGQVIPFPLAKAKRLSVKAVDHNVTYGDLVLNTFK